MAPKLLDFFKRIIEVLNSTTKSIKDDLNKETDPSKRKELTRSVNHHVEFNNKLKELFKKIQTKDFSSANNLFANLPWSSLKHITEKATQDKNLTEADIEEVSNNLMDTFMSYVRKLYPEYADEIENYATNVYHTLFETLFDFISAHWTELEDSLSNLFDKKPKADEHEHLLKPDAPQPTPPNTPEPAPAPKS